MGSLQPSLEHLFRRRDPMDEAMLGGPRAQRLTGFDPSALGLTPELLQAIASQGGNVPVQFGQGNPAQLLGVSGPMSTNQIIAQGQTSAAPAAGMPGATGPVGWISPQVARAALELFGPLFAPKPEQPQQPATPATQTETNLPGQRLPFGA